MALDHVTVPITISQRCEQLVERLAGLQVASSGVVGSVEVTRESINMDTRYNTMDGVITASIKL